jgi:NAD(P)-dependent dehydrogenase (short-subunit alcohol dehydrogenase family)
MIERLTVDAFTREGFDAVQPIGRRGRPEEVAATVVWLCSDAASLVTGIAMPVDGGATAGSRRVSQPDR